MCHTMISGTDDDENMDEISSTSPPPTNSKKPGKLHIEPRKVWKNVFFIIIIFVSLRMDMQPGDDLFGLKLATPRCTSP